MKSTTTLAFALFVLIAVACAPASAAVEHWFDFRGPDDNNIGHSKVFTSNLGLNLTATAWRGAPSSGDAPFSNLDDTFLSQYSSLGIGVEHAVDGGTDSAEPIDDSNFEPEVLRLDLGSVVGKLVSVTFAWVNSDLDEFDLGVDGVDQDIRNQFSYTPFGSADQGSIYRIAGGSGTVRTVDFSGTTIPSGKVFEFYTDDSGDQYKIKKIHIEVPDQVVPEPASMMVWALLSMVGVAASRRTMVREEA